MSLWLTETADQALIARVVNEAYQVANREGHYVGRTAVQKLAYFLKARGVPMSYKFDIYHYGPYSDALQRDVEWMLADDVLKDISRNPDKYSSYAPGDTIDEALQLHKERIEPFHDVIREVVEALVPLTPEELELTATLDYMYRKIQATGVGIPGKDRVVQSFIEVKKDKFPYEQISKTYDSMAAAGVFL